MKRDQRPRANSVDSVYLEPLATVIWGNRSQSPLLRGDFVFREESLINHYFMIHFKRHFATGFGESLDVPSRGTVDALIMSNSALRHAICALTLLSFPSSAPSLANEVVAHIKLSIAFIKNTIDNGILDEETLLAILVLLRFEVQRHYCSRRLILYSAASRKSLQLAGSSRCCIIARHSDAFLE
jgi:hypothetical protein